MTAKVDPYLARLGPETGAVVERQPRFALPLVHHLVEQRLRRRRPAVPAHVSSGEGDLAGAPFVIHPEFAQTGAHPVGDRDREGREQSAEVAGVENLVQPQQPMHHRLMLGRDHARAAWTTPRWDVSIDRESQESAARDKAFGAGHPRREEAHDGGEHIVGSPGESAVQPQTEARVVRHQHGTVARQGDIGSGREPEPEEPVGECFLGCEFEGEVELTVFGASRRW